MVTDKIRELRIKYENEMASLQNKHRDVLRRLNEELSRARTADYAAPYKARYTEISEIMEEFYQKILTIERDTHGLEFYSEEYLSSNSDVDLEEDFRENNVEDVFEEIMRLCCDIVEELEESHTVDEYEEILTSFCDILLVMRYIVKNSSKLLKNSGYPDEDRLRALNEVEKKIDAENQSYAEASKKENLICHNELVSLAEELESIYARTSAELLGNQNIGDDGQYRYLIAFYVENVPENDANFCENVLGVDREKLGREPVYLEPQTGCCNLIINAPKEFLASEDYYELIRNIYFSFATKLDKNMLQFGYIDCHEGVSVLQRMYNLIDSNDNKKLLGADGNFCYSNVKERRSEHVEECLKRISDDCNDIISHYSDGVIAHNLVTPKNKLPLRVVVVNFYPEGFVDTFRAEKLNEKLQKLMVEYRKSGFIFIVCQDINTLENGNGIKLDAKQCNAIDFSISQKDYNKWKNTGKSIGSCGMYISDRFATVDISVPGFDENEYWECLKKYYSQKKIFALREIFKKTDMETNNWTRRPSVFEDKAIEIPLGLKGAEDYSLRFPLPAAGHTLIYGGSNAGKSSFLHTLILSMCYKYSSDDIEIYLADFKETEFNFYQKHQLPHIKYYLCKNGVSEVLDIFDMIERVRIDRGALLHKYGCHDILQYNQKAMNDSRMKKMPVIFFIVDEYKIIETVVGSNSSVMRRINSSISNTLSQARAMGINLVLCTQNISTIEEIDTGNVKNYILMGKQETTDLYIRQYFLDNNRDYNIKEVKDFLAVAESGHCLIRSASSIVGEMVRVAYAGKETKEEYVKDICSLRSNEQISMVLGGSEERIGVCESSDYRSNAEKFDNDKFNLTLGIGSASGFPISVDFNTKLKGETLGWSVYSESEENVFGIIRNTILSFLYKTAILEYDYSDQNIKERVVYLGDNRSYSLTLGKRYFGKFNRSVINSNVKMLNVDEEEDIRDICSLIMDLSEQFETYKKEMKKEGVKYSETYDYPPYLLIIQSLEWFERSNIEYFLGEQNETEELSEKEEKDYGSRADEVDLDDYADILGFVLEDFGDDEDNEKNQSIVSKTPRKMGYDAVKDALMKLFVSGSKYGIFVVINPDSKESLSDIFGSRVDYWKNCVYGTFEEFNDNDVSQDSSYPSKNICYVGESGIKTRLYDYSPDTQIEWWQKFNTIMEGK